MNRIIGKLKKENWLTAKEMLSNRLGSEGTPMKVNAPIEILPPPQEAGDVIFSQIGNEYIAKMDGVVGHLTWRRTGKILEDDRGCLWARIA